MCSYGCSVRHNCPIRTTVSGHHEYDMSSSRGSMAVPRAVCILSALSALDWLARYISLKFNDVQLLQQRAVARHTSRGTRGQSLILCRPIKFACKQARTHSSRTSLYYTFRVNYIHGTWMVRRRSRRTAVEPDIAVPPMNIHSAGGSLAAECFSRPVTNSWCLETRSSNAIVLPARRTSVIGHTDFRELRPSHRTPRVKVCVLCWALHARSYTANASMMSRHKMLVEARSSLQEADYFTVYLLAGTFLVDGDAPKRRKRDWNGDNLYSYLHIKQLKIAWKSTANETERLQIVFSNVACDFQAHYIIS